MIAAYVLAFLPLVWPVPMEAKPFPPRPRLPSLVDVYLHHPSAEAGTDLSEVGGAFPVVVVIDSDDHATPGVVVLAQFQDSCGQLRGETIRTVDLPPYAVWQLNMAVDVPVWSCPGWGYVEVTVSVGGQLAVMGWQACAERGREAGCRARLDVPVMVVP